jgi:hypothetical protein
MSCDWRARLADVVIMAVPEAREVREAEGVAVG